MRRQVQTIKLFGVLLLDLQNYTSLFLFPTLVLGSLKSARKPYSAADREDGRLEEMQQVWCYEILKSAGSPERFGRAPATSIFSTYYTPSAVDRTRARSHN